MSYFEWAQNIQHFKWDEERVNAELDKTMAKAYAAVRGVATEFDTDLRTAAFVLAIRRVAKAALARTHVAAGLAVLTGNANVRHGRVRTPDGRCPSQG